jgi:RNA polymerase sigma factor (sigma-70 family)
VHNGSVRLKQFERMYADHAGRIYALFAYRTGDRALAEDLLADTFERALSARRRFDPRKGSETAWLYAIALNRLRDHQRRAEAERRAVERSWSPDEHDPGSDAFAERDEVRQALGVLSDEERDVVALRFGADLTAPQIARATGESLTTIEGRLYRALRKLRAALDAPAAVDLPSTSVQRRQSAATRRR